MFALTAFDEIESATPHVREIHRQFNFAMNHGPRALIVPGIAMPTVKITSGRQRLPTFCLCQFILRSEVARQNLFDQRVNCQIDKSLIEQEYVFDHVTIDLGLLVTVKVIPTRPSQARGKSFLHAAQLLARQKIRQKNYPIRFQIRDQPIDMSGMPGDFSFKV